MKILIIQQKMIGDVLTSSILFEVLKNNNKEVELHYLINSHTSDIINNNPFIDEVIYFTPEVEKSYWKFIAFIKKIRSKKYDVIIDVYGKLSSNLITLFSGASIKISYYKKLSSFIYSHPIKRLKKPQNKASLAIENRLRLLDPLNILINYSSPKIYLQQSEIDLAKELLIKFSIDLSKPLYMISVLGSNSKKTYPSDYMAKLLDSIVSEKPDSQLLFNYIPSQFNDAKKIYDLCTKTTQGHIFFDLYGKSLLEFLALTHHCDALIGNEGGAINMAKALQVPAFIIFSPHLNKANWFGELENDNHVAVHLSDYINHQEKDRDKAKDKPSEYYLKFKPTFIEPKLIDFLRNLR